MSVQPEAYVNFFGGPWNGQRHTYPQANPRIEVPLFVRQKMYDNYAGWRVSLTAEYELRRSSNGVEWDAVFSGYDLTINPPLKKQALINYSTEELLGELGRRAE